MTAGDWTIIVGFTALIAGITAQFGYPCGLMAGGCLLMMAGAGLQRSEGRRG